MRQHANAVNVLAVQWAINNEILPKGTISKVVEQEMGQGKVIKNYGKIMVGMGTRNADYVHSKETRFNTGGPEDKTDLWDWHGKPKRSK